MLTTAVKRYLAIRRAAGFRLRVTEGFLRSYTRFAIGRSETHVRSQTVLEWAAQASSASQRARRLEAVTIFARHARAEDAQHEVPPKGAFPRQDYPTGLSSSQSFRVVNWWSTPRACHPRNHCGRGRIARCFPY
jgi:hypothetical protein